VASRAWEPYLLHIHPAPHPAVTNRSSPHYAEALGERGHHERARQTRGDHVGANPVDRGKPGSKLHLVCDGGGLPLTVAVTAANVSEGVRDALVMWGLGAASGRGR
jgi:hypothetical protein